MVFVLWPRGTFCVLRFALCTFSLAMNFVCLDAMSIVVYSYVWTVLNQIDIELEL